MIQLTYDQLACQFPKAWEAVPECYRNDSCLKFFLDVNGNLCAEGDSVCGTDYVWTGSKWV